jgi:Lon protease-like protein
MGELEGVVAALSRLKVFPLPTVVLFPGTVVPLRIFEPRYRAMIYDALRGDRLIALAMLAPGWEADYHGRPPMRRIFGAGRIIEDERLPDGRYDIQVGGLARVELISELPPERDYREVRAQLAGEVPGAGPSGAALRNAILALCSNDGSEGALALARAASNTEQASRLADLCAATLAPDSTSRQRFMETLDVDARCQMALDLVGEHLARSRAGRPTSKEELN